MKKIMIALSSLALTGMGFANLLQDYTGETVGSSGTNHDIDLRGPRNNDTSNNPNIQSTGGAGNSAYYQIFGGFGGTLSASEWFHVGTNSLSIGTAYTVRFDYTAVDVGSPSESGMRGQDFLNVVVATDNGSTGWSSGVDPRVPMSPNASSSIELREQIGTNMSAVGWTTYTSTSTFTLDATDNNVMVAFEYGGWGANAANPTDDYDYIGIDNVELVATVIPEPNTVAMLFVGGLAALAMRRIRRENV